MNIRSLTVVILFIGIFLSGCAANIVPRYSSHTANMIDLKKIGNKSNVKLKVNDFTSSALNDKKESCRGMGIMPPDGKTFSSFIKSALADELIVSDMYSDASIMEINGNMKNIELHAASISEGNWIIEVEISIAKKKPFLVSINRPFSSGFAGYTACENAKTAFVPTVQDFINLVITHPEFQSAIFSNKKGSQ